MPTRPDIESVAEEVFTALADPSRRAILAALAANGPATATDLAGRLPITRQAIAKHLALLADAGLVAAEPGERRRVRYRLRSAPMQVAQQFLAALARDWDRQLDALKDHLNIAAAVQPRKKEQGNETVMNTTVSNAWTWPPEWQPDRQSRTGHRIGTREEWAAAREQLLAREKEHTRLGDELASQRRELPWVRVEKDYRFDTDDGPRTLAELFEGRSQLLIYHFMFGPSYEAGCPINSSIADNINGLLPHLNAHDVTMLLVSQAPAEKLHTYKRRMGWDIPWVSSANSEFNFDLGYSSNEEQTRAWVAQNLGSLPPIVDLNASASGTDVAGYLTESPGFSAFVLEDGVVYQTYATGWRGVEFLMGYYPILDRAPKGRDEEDGFQLWIRRHDEYDG
jgi:predicted dithiol-disulfide oxidoreductase (DUF899 family)/DNA-binding transcriptional ArsR family regulator